MEDFLKICEQLFLRICFSGYYQIQNMKNMNRAASKGFFVKYVFQKRK